MSYTIRYSVGNVVLAPTTSNAFAGINLMGQNYPDYGQNLNQNWLSMTENFASNIAGPSNPIPGQLWYDVANVQLKVNTSQVAYVPTWTTILSSLTTISTVANGTSGLYVPATSGDVFINANGRSNVAVFSSDTSAFYSNTSVFSHDVAVGGNLFVNGNTNFVNVSQLSIQDPLIDIGGGPNGAPLTSNDGKDRGLVLHYYTTLPTDAFMGWQNSTGEFIFASNANVSNNIVTVNEFGNVQAGNFIGNLIGNITGNVSGTIAGSSVIGAVAFATTANAVAGANVTGTVASATSAASANSVAGANVTGAVALATSATTATTAVSATSATTAGSTTTVTAGGSVTTRIITTGAAGTGGNITGAWVLTAGSTLQSSYADIAEFYAADAEYASGTVVEFGGSEEVTLCGSDMSSRVAGVVTTDPSYILNKDIKAAHPVRIALQGRVPVQVTGYVHKGDMLVSAGNGLARSEDNPVIGSVIGKALEHKHTAEIGTIEVSVGR